MIAPPMLAVLPQKVQSRATSPPVVATAPPLAYCGLTLLPLNVHRSRVRLPDA